MDQKQEVHYSVQVGIFNNPEAAQNVSRPLRVLGYPVMVEKRGALYYVMVGDFSILEEANELESDLKTLGYDTMVKEYSESIPDVIE